MGNHSKFIINLLPYSFVLCKIHSRSRSRKQEAIAIAIAIATATATATAAAMDGPKRAKPGLLDTAFKVITRRNSVYISFILVGALVGERVLDASTNKLWHYNNKGKMYEEISVLGQRVAAEE